jgi:hypothetical protein
MNQGQTGKFLDALFSAYFKGNEGKIEFRFIPKGPGPAYSLFFRLAEFNEEAFAGI